VPLDRLLGSHSRCNAICVSSPPMRSTHRAIPSSRHCDGYSHWTLPRSAVWQCGGGTFFLTGRPRRVNAGPSLRVWHSRPPQRHVLRLRWRIARDIAATRLRVPVAYSQSPALGPWTLTAAGRSRGPERPASPVFEMAHPDAREGVVAFPRAGEDHHAAGPAHRRLPPTGLPHC